MYTARIRDEGGGGGRERERGKRGIKKEVTGEITHFMNA